MTSPTGVLGRLTTALDADRLIEAVNPMWSGRLRGSVTAIRPLTPTAVVITIRTNRSAPPFRAGQYVPIGVEIGGVRHHRTYSLTSAPGRSRRDRTIEIAVQRVDGGLVSGHLTSALRVGDIVDLGSPSGDFTLPDDSAGAPSPLLLITGGSGITPAISMLRELEARSRSGRAVADTMLVHHARERSSTMFADEIARITAAVPEIDSAIVHTSTQGRLTVDRLDALCPTWSRRETYVCGPGSLIDVATETWDDAGLLDRLHVEQFTPRRPYGAIGDPGADTPAATFTRSAVTARAATSETLLETAERAGAIVPFGCRNGICHTCTTRLDAGTTTNLRSGATATAGDHIQLCVSRAETPVTLDA